jgi:hypothetical protein
MIYEEVLAGELLGIRSRCSSPAGVCMCLLLPFPFLLISLAPVVQGPSVRWKRTSWLLNLIALWHVGPSVCRSCYSGPLSISILLASICAALQGNIFGPLCFVNMCACLNFYFITAACSVELPHVVQLHHPFFFGLPLSAPVPVLVFFWFS